MSHSKTITDLFEFDYANDKNFNLSCKFLLNVPIVMDGDVLHIRNEMFPVQPDISMIFFKQLNDKNTFLELHRIKKIRENKNNFPPHIIFEMIQKQDMYLRYPYIC